MSKNITLSADAELIQRAREKARREKTSLNQRFREWLAKYVQSEKAAGSYSNLMEELAHVSPGKTFSRDELNER
ncbi:MAG: hypothetical protein AAGC85_16945 [Bacteroidota bacterium]